MSDPKRDLPKEVFKNEIQTRIHIENEVMREIDNINVKKVKPLGIRPQLMAFFIMLFFFVMALIGVLADISQDIQLISINGFEVGDLFGKIPVEWHLTILVLSGAFLVYTMISSLRDYAKAS